MRRTAPLALILGCQPAFDEARFAVRYAESVCAQEGACDAGSPWLDQGKDACVDQVADAWFVPRETVGCEPFDPALGRACVDAIRAASCGAREALGEGPDACADVTAPNDCPVPGFVGVTRTRRPEARPVRPVRARIGRRFSGVLRAAPDATVGRSQRGPRGAITPAASRPPRPAFAGLGDRAISRQPKERWASSWRAKRLPAPPSGA